MDQGVRPPVGLSTLACFQTRIGQLAISKSSIYPPPSGRGHS